MKKLLLFLIVGMFLFSPFASAYIDYKELTKDDKYNFLMSMQSIISPQSMIALELQATFFNIQDSSSCSAKEGTIELDLELYNCALTPDGKWCRCDTREPTSSSTSPSVSQESSKSCSSSSTELFCSPFSNSNPETVSNCEAWMQFHGCSISCCENAPTTIETQTSGLLNNGQSCDKNSDCLSGCCVTWINNVCENYNQYCTVEYSSPSDFECTREQCDEDRVAILQGKLPPNNCPSSDCLYLIGEAPEIMPVEEVTRICCSNWFGSSYEIRTTFEGCEGWKFGEEVDMSICIDVQEAWDITEPEISSEGVEELVHYEGLDIPEEEKPVGPRDIIVTPEPINCKDVGCKEGYICGDDGLCRLKEPTITTPTGRTTIKQISLTKSEWKIATNKMIVNAMCETSNECSDREDYEVECKYTEEIKKRNVEAWGAEEAGWLYDNFCHVDILGALGWLSGYCQEQIRLEIPDGTCRASKGFDYFGWIQDIFGVDESMAKIIGIGIPAFILLLFMFGMMKPRR